MEYLRSCDGHYDFNVILEIESSTTCSAGERRALACVDAFLSSQDKGSLHTVANTIFPDSLYRRMGTKGVFEVYPDVVYPRIMRCKENRWGTYAQSTQVSGLTCS